MLQFILNFIWLLELLSDLLLIGFKAIMKELRTPIEMLCQAMNMYIFVYFTRYPNNT